MQTQHKRIADRSLVRACCTRMSEIFLHPKWVDMWINDDNNTDHKTKKWLANGSL